MGQRLTEQGVAEAMGTSAGPVREAFASLSREGLLISLPHRGTFVSSVSQEEARGAYEVRHRLEPYAFELASTRLTPEANAELDRLVERPPRRGVAQGLRDDDRPRHALPRHLLRALRATRSWSQSGRFSRARSENSSPSPGRNTAATTTTSPGGMKSCWRTCARAT